MAYAKKCDICGELYEVKWADNNEAFNRMYLSWNHPSGTGPVYNEEDYDVCPVCSTAIKRLFRTLALEGSVYFSAKEDR